MQARDACLVGLGDGGHIVEDQRHHSRVLQQRRQTLARNLGRTQESEQASKCGPNESSRKHAETERDQRTNQSVAQEQQAKVNYTHRDAVELGPLAQVVLVRHDHAHQRRLQRIACNEQEAMMQWFRTPATPELIANTS